MLTNISLCIYLLIVYADLPDYNASFTGAKTLEEVHEKLPSPMELNQSLIMKPKNPKTRKQKQKTKKLTKGIE